VSVETSLREGFARTVTLMKDIGLDVGSYRLSLYGLFSAIVVAILLWIAVKLPNRALKWLLRRNSQIDEAQRLLAEVETE